MGSKAARKDHKHIADEKIMLGDPRIAGFYLFRALWEWLKYEPWLVLPLLASLVIITLCEAPGSFLHRTYTPETIQQIHDISLLVGTLDLFIIMFRRLLFAWICFGAIIEVMAWLCYLADGKVRILRLALFYGMVFIVGAMVSIIWPYEKQTSTPKNPPMQDHFVRRFIAKQDRK